MMVMTMVMILILVEVISILLHPGGEYPTKPWESLGSGGCWSDFEACGDELKASNVNK